MNKYIELLCSKDSPLNKIENFEERQKAAAQKVGIKDPEALWGTDMFKEAVHEFMSKQSNNKYQNLFTSQVMLWNTQRLALNPYEGTDEEKLAKGVVLREKISDLTEKLEERISKLLLEVYKEERIIAIAKEQIVKKVMTPEERILKAN